jgi:hypothetical protein
MTILIVPGKFYVATHPDWEDLPFIVADARTSRERVIWGFSVYRNSPGYRTLGVPLDGWLAWQDGVVITEDRDRRLDKRARKPKPVDPRDAEIVALRAQVEELRFGATSWIKAYARGRDEERARLAYQRGNRDGLLSFAAECDARAESEKQQAATLRRHRTMGERLSVNRLYASEAWQEAGALARRRSEALPEEPANVGAPRPPPTPTWTATTDPPTWCDVCSTPMERCVCPVGVGDRGEG